MGAYRVWTVKIRVDKRDPFTCSLFLRKHFEKKTEGTSVFVTNFPSFANEHSLEKLWVDRDCNVESVNIGFLGGQKLRYAIVKFETAKMAEDALRIPSGNVWEMNPAVGYQDWLQKHLFPSVPSIDDILENANAHVAEYKESEKQEIKAFEDRQGVVDEDGFTLVSRKKVARPTVVSSKRRKRRSERPESYKIFIVFSIGRKRETRSPYCVTPLQKIYERWNA